MWLNSDFAILAYFGRLLVNNNFHTTVFTLVKVIIWRSTTLPSRLREK